MIKMEATTVLTGILVLLLIIAAYYFLRKEQRRLKRDIHLYKNGEPSSKRLERLLGRLDKFGKAKFYMLHSLLFPLLISSIYCTLSFIYDKLIDDLLLY